MSTDLTFITNGKGENLQKRFEALIKDTRFFDALVNPGATKKKQALSGTSSQGVTIAVLGLPSITSIG